MTREPEPSRVEVTAIFGAFGQEGLVQLQIGPEKLLLPPAKAREIAAFLIEAAGAAEADEALVAVLRRIETPEELVAQVLMAMRMERSRIDERARREMRRAYLEDQGDPDLPES